MREFNPQRLVVARKRRGQTMTALARLVGVQSRTISAHQNGEFPPSDETLASISKHLRFPVSFFYGPDLDMPDTRSTSFRALSRMKAPARDAALGAAALALLIAERVEAEFQLPRSEIPDLHAEDPETSAETTRSGWVLGYRAISNMIHLLELKGIRVFSLPLDLAEDEDHGIDAFSFWCGNTPFIFLNTNVTAERMRFDCAHELGHLVMHRHGGPVGQAAEVQANTFGSAFLMPASSVFAAVKHPVTLSRLVELKARWGVSVSALAYRLWKLQVLSNWQYRSMIIETKRFGRKEPKPMPKEKSQLWQKVFAELRREGIPKRRLAQTLSIPQADLEGLTFGLNVTDGETSKSSKPRRGAHLKVVE